MPRRGEPPPDSAHLCVANSDEGKGQGGYLRLLGSALVTVDRKQIVLPRDKSEGDLRALANNGSFNLLKESEARRKQTWYKSARVRVIPSVARFSAFAL